MVYDIQRQISIAYGWSYSPETDSQMFTFDGQNWTYVDYVGLWPVARSDFGMAYDSNRDVVVIFGGWQGDFDYLGDTWEWNGSEWTEMFPQHSPSDRYGHAMTYNPSIQKCILFGGFTESLVCVDETWTWDGNDWTIVTSLLNPSGRSCSCLVYDSFEHRCLLYGGTEDGIFGLDDTWELDGPIWSEITTDNRPPGRYLHSMVYDSSRKGTIVFGGGGYPLDDTWEFDGTDWTQIPVQHHPSARGGAAACYDSIRNRTVLFGGYSDGAMNDTWEYYDVPPSGTPTITPTPTETPTITPTPTNTPPCPFHGVTLEMPSHDYSPGSYCYLRAFICNQDQQPLENIPFFCLLEVAGVYWYYPTWSETPDWETLPVAPSGAKVMTIIEPFRWPSDVGEGSGLRFLSAITDPEITEVIGEVGEWEFGWSDFTKREKNLTIWK